MRHDVGLRVVCVMMLICHVLCVLFFRPKKFTFKSFKRYFFTFKDTHLSMYRSSADVDQPAMYTLNIKGECLISIFTLNIKGGCLISIFTLNIKRWILFLPCLDNYRILAG